MSAPAPTLELKKDAQADTRSVASGTASSVDDDNKLLEIGYVPSFRREFSNIATVSLPSYLRHWTASHHDVCVQISFAFSIMGLCSSVATTLNVPWTLGGPSSVTWCWILGAVMCFTLGAYLLPMSRLRNVPEESE